MNKNTFQFVNHLDRRSERKVESTKNSPVDQRDDRSK